MAEEPKTKKITIYNVVYILIIFGLYIWFYEYCIRASLSDKIDFTEKNQTFSGNISNTNFIESAEKKQTLFRNLLVTIIVFDGICMIAYNLFVIIFYLRNINDTVEIQSIPGNGNTCWTFIVKLARLGNLIISIWIACLVFLKSCGSLSNTSVCTALKIKSYIFMGSVSLFGLIIGLFILFLLILFLAYCCGEKCMNRVLNFLSYFKRFAETNSNNIIGQTISISTNITNALEEKIKQSQTTTPTTTDICCICQLTKDETRENYEWITLDCKHIFHKDCMLEQVNKGVNPNQCPMCRKDIIISINIPKINSTYNAQYQSSVVPPLDIV